MEEETPQSAAWVEVWRREVFTTATDAARAAVLQQAALAALKQPKRTGAPARDTPSKAAAEAARAAATPVTSDTFLMVAAEKWLAHPQNVFPGVVATAVAPVDPADARGEAGVRETVCAYVARGAAEGYETLRAAARRLTVDAHVMGRVYEGCAEGFVHDVVLVQRARAAPPSTDEDPLDSSARHRVVYVPNLAPVAAEVANTELLATAPRRMYLPKWYPKAQAFAFVFDRTASALSMSAIPLPDDSSEESLKKIVCCRVLDVCLCVSVCGSLVLVDAGVHWREAAQEARVLGQGVCCSLSLSLSLSRSVCGFRQFTGHVCTVSEGGRT